MPIYEYDCPRCGVFEATQRITENPLSHCPTCKSKVKKLISRTSFQLKGTGWYVTDYGNRGNGASARERSAKDASRDNGGGKKDSRTEEAGGKKDDASATT